MSDTTYLTAPEVAERLRLTEKGLATMRYRGTGPDFYRIGQGVRYKLSDLEKWEAAQRVTTLDD